MSSHIIQATYRFLAATVSSSGIIGRIVGPEGRKGRITSMSALCTTNITGSEGTIDAGNSSTADAYMTLTVPNTSANDRVAGVLSIAYARGMYPVSSPNQVIEISVGGEPTAGAADIVVTMDWE